MISSARTAETWGITLSGTGKRLNESTSLIESRLKPGPLLELGRGDNYARLQLQRDTAKKYA